VVSKFDAERLPFLRLIAFFLYLILPLLLLGIQPFFPFTVPQTLSWCPPPSLFPPPMLFSGTPPPFWTDGPFPLSSILLINFFLSQQASPSPVVFFFPTPPSKQLSFQRADFLRVLRTPSFSFFRHSVFFYRTDETVPVKRFPCTPSDPRLFPPDSIWASPISFLPSLSWLKFPPGCRKLIPQPGLLFFVAVGNQK